MTDNRNANEKKCQPDIICYEKKVDDVIHDFNKYTLKIIFVLTPVLVLILIFLIIIFFANNSFIQKSDKKIVSNSIGMKFVYIPPGIFMMGSPEDEQYHMKNEKRHIALLTKGFYMQTTEVTQGQWKAMMGENPSWSKSCGDNCPVEIVSWQDVQNFIKKLNEQSSGKYRLPSEKEWEYACRAGTTTPYHTGDKIADLDRAGWHSGNSEVTSHQVGLKEANAWGLYDMHGSLWEWCSMVNYSKPDYNDVSNRIMRGGSFANCAAACRSACRLQPGSEYRSFVLGFRLVMITD